jgi:intergrase/recombinase
MIKAMPREVARFIQSRFGELKISEAGYEDLLGEADKYFLGCLSYIQSTLKHHFQRTLRSFKIEIYYFEIGEVYG